LQNSVAGVTPLNYRLTSYDLGLGSLWTLLAILNLLPTRRIHIPLTSFLALVALGVVVGVTISILNTRRMLMYIEKKGMFSPSLSYILFTLGTLFIALGLLFFGGSSVFTSQEFSLILIFLCPMPATVLFARALICKFWERKNKRVIYISPGIITGKIYAYPHIFNNENSYGQD